MVLYQTAGGYENLILELFGGYYALENVKIHQKINEHATIELTAIVTEQSAKKYETEPLNRHSLRLVQKGEEEIIHFGGMLQKLIVERKDGILIFKNKTYLIRMKTALIKRWWRKRCKSILFRAMLFCGQKRAERQKWGGFYCNFKKRTGNLSKEWLP